MADLKISQLTSATTPLAGTEVLPIVQSSSTKKVATDDLTVKNVRSNATTGILQVAGPGAGTTRVMTTPNANFTVARTDAAQSFTGDQTLSTGNLVQGTAAKGFSFAANTPLGGMSSQLLNWYEEGYYVGALTADTGTITLTYDRLNYTRVGRMVTVSGEIVVNTLSSPAPTGDVYLSLPFTAATSVSGRSGAWSSYLGVAYTFTGTPGGPLVGLFSGADTKMIIRVGNNAGGASFAGFLAAGTTFDVGFTYQCQ
jgi:hypothetical protein